MTKSIFVVLFLVSCCSLVLAQVPLTMSYQGYLTDNAGTPVPDGTYSIVFSIYITEVGGIALWTETHPVVSVNKGLFNVILGQGTPSNPLNIPFDKQYFLGIRVGVDPEMTPRVRMSSVAYSLHSRTSDNLANPSALILGGDVTGPLTANSIATNAVTTPKIANDAVITAKIANDAVITPKIANDAVITAKIANDAVTTPKIDDDAVTKTKILPDIVSSLNGVSNDGGNIDLIAGANITITPDNAANTIKIAAGGGGGLTLPYYGTVSSSASTAAFDVENTGTGRAGYFHINNAASSNFALWASNNGQNTTADAIYAQSFWGRAINCLNNHAITPTIYAENMGGGPVATFLTLGASSGNIMNISKNGGAGRGINMTYGGTGSAIYVDNNSSGIGLELKQDGTGNAAYFHVENTITNQDALIASTEGTIASDALVAWAANGKGLYAGSGGDTQPTIYAFNNNSSLAAPIIALGGATTRLTLNRRGDMVLTAGGTGFEITQDGTGNAAYFHCDNTATTSNTLRATTAGTSSSSDALEVVAVNGSGLNASSSGSSSPTIYGYNSNASASAPIMILSGAGPVMWVERSGETIISGPLGIGTTAPTLPLHVVGNAGKTAGGNTWNVISDIRLKNVDGAYTRGLDDIMKLRSIRYHYKPDNPRGYASNTEEIGFVAQEVQKVFPECVTEDKDGYLNFNMHAVNVAMVNAIQELNKKLEAERANTQALREEIAQLKNMVTKLVANSENQSEQKVSYKSISN